MKSPHIRLRSQATVLRKKHQLTTCRHFFHQVFMVPRAENVLDSAPASGWSLISLNCRSPYWVDCYVWYDDIFDIPNMEHLAWHLTDGALEVGLRKR